MNAKLKMTVSMLIFGTIALFVRQIDLSSSGVAFYRAFIALIGLCIFKLIRRERFFDNVSKKNIFMLMLSGAAMGFNWIFLFESYKYTSVAVSTICYYFAPVIVMMLCPFIFKERVTGIQILCFVMSTVGIVLITLSGGIQSGSVRGALLALIAAVLYASVMLLNKGINGISGIDRTLGQFLFAALVIFPYALLTNGISLKTLDLKGLICLIFVGLVYTCISYVLYLTAVSELPGRLTAIMGYLDPLCACALSALVFREGISILQIIGGVLILGFTLIESITEKNV